MVKNYSNYILLTTSLLKENNLLHLDRELSANYLPLYYKNHFCFFHGAIHNENELQSLTGLIHNNFEEVLIELYLKDPVRFPAQIKGNFSIIIGNDESIYLVRDGNGYENLYYSINTYNNRLIISNSIKEIAKYISLEVNINVLPAFFLMTDINSGETFFKNINTLAFFEYREIDRNRQSVKKGIFDDFFIGNDIVTVQDVDKVVNDLDHLIGQIINEKINDCLGHFTIVNSLSGGTDSSFIQYYLKKNATDMSYTANFKDGGLDYKYATDVARLLELRHKVIHSDTKSLIDDLPDSIYTSEKPYVFSGESLLNRMYKAINTDYVSNIACFDGAGAEGIMGASKILYELRMIRKYNRISSLVIPVLKLFSRKSYERYKEFHSFVNLKYIPDNFILRYFTDESQRDIIQKAFNLPNLAEVDLFEMSIIKKYDTTLFESVYRYFAFELEYRRVNNIRNQLAKKYNICLIFPFTELSLFKFMVKLDTEIKLRHAKTKYVFRKAMGKKFPSEIIYRKKIKKNVSVFDQILQNERIKEIITEIKKSNYSYFNFNYNDVFGSPENSSLALKLINFHIWHKLFIDRVSLHDFEEN